VECGYLTVAEDRLASSPTERGELQLAVGVFKAVHPNAAVAPLIYLDGGPGAPALDDVVGGWPLFAPLVVDRDLVVLDQRGTGHSKPALSCDTVMTAGDGGSDFLAACRNDLAAKVVSLSHFDSASSATDVNDLRVALGYPLWNLFGISYGTRLALTVLRDYPESVRSIVIDSVLPPQVDALAEAGKNANRAFDVIFDSCASQPDCLRAFPTLRQDFYDTIAALSATPAAIALDGGEVFPLDADLTIDILLSICYSAPAIAYVPEFIDGLHRADYSLMKQILSAMGSAGGGGFATGMNFSVVCREMAPFTSRQAIAQADSDLPPILAAHFDAKGLLDLCDQWMVTPANSIEHLPVASDRPGLVLSGGYDPVTPPASSQLAASTLSHATFLGLADQSHGAFESPCGRSVIDRFVTDPAAAPDVSCAESLAPIALLAPPATKAAALVRSWPTHEKLPDAVLASILRGIRLTRTRLK